MTRKLFLILLIVGCCITSFAGKKVLYFTHEPGRWHKYTPQLAEFKAIAKEAGWEMTASTGSYQEQINKLKEKDFAKGYDAIIYNFCFAGSKDLEACANLIKQTEENGVPCMLIHCSMHSWWSTYKRGKVPVGVNKGKAEAKLVKEWKKNHPNEKFPVWGDFTGVASTSHGPKLPVKAVAIKKDHPALKDFKDYTTSSPKSELYNNFYITEDTIPLVKGIQVVGKDKKEVEAVIMWEAPRGKGRLIGLTLGHSVDELKDEGFKTLVKGGLNYLMKK